MSQGNPYSGGIYSSIQTTDTSGFYNQFSYPPPSSASPSSTPSIPPNGKRLSQPGPPLLNPAGYGGTGPQPETPSAGGVLAMQGVPGAPPSNTLHCDSPKPTSFQQPYLSLDQHDFTALNHQNDPHRWSYDSQPPPEVRRWTKTWWRYKWRVQVSQRKLPRLLYGVTGFVLLVVWIAVSAGFANNLEANEAKNSVIPIDGTASGFENAGINIFLSGQLNFFDPETRTLNIDWGAILLRGPVKVGDIKLAERVSTDDFGMTIAIFKDQVARPDFERNATELGYIPYRIKNPNVKPIGYLGVSEFDQINTEVGMSQSSDSIYSQPGFGYPFDIFKGVLTLVACNNNTITRLGRPGIDVMRLEGSVLEDSLLNLKVRTNTNATCLDPIHEGCELIIDILAERTGLVKFTVVVVFILTWTVTIAIFLVTGEALLLNRKDILEGTDILSVCFSALFALPTVRTLLPGAPGVGCLLDTVCILPCVIVVTLCTVFFTNSRLRMRAHQKRVEQVAISAEQVGALKF